MKKINVEVKNRVSKLNRCFRKKGTREIKMEKKLTIIIENCPQNHKCPAVKVCPVGALTQNEFEAPKIDHEKCIRCGKCSNFCPKKALVL